MQPPPLAPPSNNIAQPPPLFPSQQQGNQLKKALPNAPPLMPPPLSILKDPSSDQNAEGDDKRTDKTPNPVDILPGPFDKFLVYETNSPNPPPSLNNFITVDKGNSGPRYQIFNLHYTSNTRSCKEIFYSFWLCSSTISRSKIWRIFRSYY